MQQYRIPHATRQYATALTLPEQLLHATGRFCWSAFPSRLSALQKRSSHPVLPATATQVLKPSSSKHRDAWLGTSTAKAKPLKYQSESHLNIAPTKENIGCLWCTRAFLRFPGHSFPAEPLLQRETQRLGSPHRHLLTGRLSICHAFHLGAHRGGETQGTGMQILHSAAPSHPHPCQVYQCQSLHKTAPAQVLCLWETLNTDFTALEETFNQPWTVFCAKPPRSLGTGGLHLTQRRIPQDVGVLVPWPCITRLSSAAA